MDDAQRRARAHAYENARPEVQALVPPSARRVLDLGCASGALGAALKARGDVEVVGIESDAAYAGDAGERLDRVVHADLAELALAPDLDARLGRFDCLIAADVLEHLVDPWSALRSYAALLDPGCRAVISLPNARHWEVFWELARHGRWPRRSAGIFDATHLRWFTLADAWGLCSQAGLEVEEVRRTARPGHSERLAATPVLRAVTAFQHVIAARRV
jgi:methionine biosynthesis protein MetW